MKIVAWNLKNIGHRKLVKQMNAMVAAAHYGNNVLDFMMNVVMGSTIWNGTNLSAVPADLFMVIELKSGGKNKGAAVSGTGVPCMANILNAMNFIAANTPALAGHYAYAQVPGMLTGRHESVGLIYNTVTLAYVGQAVLQNNTANYLLPRTPYLAQFTVGLGGPSLNVVGIHAPPPSGGAAVKFKEPISYCNRLPSCPLLMVGAPQNYFIGGDFNCAPTNTWVSNGVALTPFNNPAPPAPAGRTLTGYGTALANGTLTSVRRKVDFSQVGPLQYLNGVYDNILYYPAGNYLAYTLDLIGNLNTPGVGIVARLNNFWRISDHLPVVTDGVPAPQTIRFQPLPANATYGVTPPLILNANASPGLPITFGGAGPANLAGTTLTFTGQGTVHVTANQPGNATFNAALPVTQVIQVH